MFLKNVLSFSCLCSSPVILFSLHYSTLCPIDQGSPTSGPWTSTSLQPVRNWAAQQEVSGGLECEASSVFTAAPHRSNFCLSSASCQHYGELSNYFIIYYNVIIIEIKCTINVMHLNHSKTIPRPPVCGKVVFHKTSPWCQKGWGPLLYNTFIRQHSGWCLSSTLRINPAPWAQPTTPSMKLTHLFSFLLFYSPSHSFC